MDKGTIEGAVIHKPTDAEVLPTCAQVIGRQTLLPAIHPAVAHELAPASLLWSGSPCESTVGERAFVEVQISRGKDLDMKGAKRDFFAPLVVQSLRILLVMEGTQVSNARILLATVKGTKISAEQLQDPCATTTEPTWHS